MFAEDIRDSATDAALIGPRALQGDADE